MAPIVKIKSVVSTKLVAELRKRATSFRTAQIAARIQVPTDLTWWYYIEFGTATRRSGDAPYGGGATGPYPIDPIDRGDSSTLQSLHWGPQGAGVFMKHVSHPGIRPHPFVRQALPVIMAQLVTDIRAALTEGGFRQNVLKETLLNETMVFAKALLVENLATAAPGTREDGNLLGETASSVFEEEAEIVDAGDFSPGSSFIRPRAPRVFYDRNAKPKPVKVKT